MIIEAGKLNSRIELYAPRNFLINGENKREFVFYKEVFANIKPISARQLINSGRELHDYVATVLIRRNAEYNLIGYRVKHGGQFYNVSNIVDNITDGYLILTIENVNDN